MVMAEVIETAFKKSTYVKDICDQVFTSPLGANFDI
jgi:hypothetical protein